MSDNDFKVNLTIKGKKYLIKYDVLKISSVLSNMINDSLFEDNNIPLVPIFNIEEHIFEHIIMFLEQYFNEPMNDIPKPMKSTNILSIVQPFYASIVFNNRTELNNDNLVFLIDLLKAANFLGIKPLVELCSYKIAVLLTVLPKDKICEIFGYQNTEASNESTTNS